MFQLYPESLQQRELILNAAMHAGFSGGIVVDYPHRYIGFQYNYVFLFYKNDLIVKQFSIL